VALNVCEYACPTVPFARLDVVIWSWATMTIESAFVAVRAGFPESVALTVKLEVPAAVGVPETAPVDAFRVRPDGRVPDETLHV